MFCQNCGNQIPDGSVSCNFCGASQQSSTSLEQPFFAPPVPPVQPPVQPEPPKKDNSNKTVLITIIAALIVIIAVMVGIFVIKPMLDKDEDTTKKSKTTASEVVTEVTTVTPVTSPSVSVAYEAETAIDDYLSSFDGKALLSQTGENVNDLDKDGLLGLELFDLMLSNSEYEIISSEEISSTTAKVKVRLYIVDMATTSEIYETEVQSYVQSHPSMTEDDLYDIIPTLYGNAMQDSRVGKNTSDITFTVKLTNGKWNVQRSTEFEDLLLNAVEAGY